jgi:hypothetical protein
MNPNYPPQPLRRALRWLGRRVLKSGWKTGRWIVWIFLPGWLIAVALGALTEWLEHA